MITKRLWTAYLSFNFKAALALFLISIASCSRPQDNLHSWAKWSNFTDSTATGVFILDKDSLTVTMSSDVPFRSTPSIYNFNAFAKFNDKIIDSIVPETTWAKTEGKTGTTSMCFSQTVDHPVLLLSSVGTAGYAVSLSFSEKYTVLYDGDGMAFSNDTALIGSEGYAILTFPEDINCIAIKSSRPEYYTNVSWAVDISSYKGDGFRWLLYLVIGITLLFIFLFWRRRKNKGENSQNRAGSC